MEIDTKELLIELEAIRSVLVKKFGEGILGDIELEKRIIRKNKWVQEALDNYAKTINIEDIGLSPRTGNPLKRKGIKTVYELINLTEHEFYSIPNLGDKSVVEINDILKTYGFSLSFVDAFEQEQLPL
ncbi:hypothetical protein AM501_09505 [Aneurinibacillus migulanus]|uniref:DNA-directed RNA polymerase subunit alpha C-terminal domain-containing protein n=1 Tax=Aneurinibacillus migulanus TaxID=47500 RepID=UPI0005B8114B|nr:DNA-directed RNA polymerase subunit alpha C-terminal domain-containing protein [Aneurinibacillus migulanus]KIV58962.1 hypothetical protein TS64_04155 [Aneurinibacillus migulanus]KPD08516.1 hypothetical protein AM501_09505 [Aneurinibacillus migulanus]CEH28302.1 Bacterial RNA polymerase, alpha chain domain prot ein [Aneurinibacillus migulanus]